MAQWYMTQDKHGRLQLINLDRIYTINTGHYVGGEWWIWATYEPGGLPVRVIGPYDTEEDASQALVNIFDSTLDDTGRTAYDYWCKNNDQSDGR